MRPVVGRQALHLAINLSRLLFLFRGQMFPGLHAVEHAQLLLRRQSGEMLQALPKNLLLFRGQTVKCRIILKFALLFRRGQVFIAPEPVPRQSL